MNKFWSWFTPFILIICIIIYMLIIKVNNKKILLLDNILDEPKLIVTINDRNLYSLFDVNKYKDKDLKDITIDELNSIANLMDLKDSLNDGGSKIFYSDKLANRKFYILACHSLNGNNDIYILDNEKIGYCQND